MSVKAPGGERPRRSAKSNPTVTIYVPAALVEETDTDEWVEEVAARAFVRMGDYNARECSPKKDHG